LRVILLKTFRRIVLQTIGFLLVITGLILISGWFDSHLSQTIAQKISRRASPNWPGYFHLTGWISVLTGLVFIAEWFVWRAAGKIQENLKSSLLNSDHSLELKLSAKINLSTERELSWPLVYNRFDWLIILFFVLLALSYQISSMSQGFPTVILGGDAANIASFAAGRAYPQLFVDDAILGNLRNIGLYVTVHLPITIWLEKLVGNFGLAYSLLLFPHVFLQYFSYYLLGRVIFNSRYWALLFSLAISAPLALAGGEVWGVVNDAMPRFTFQVLIPFLLILLLSSWRNRPARWPWVMVIAGSMAFIHPVSTPTWAFALWLGIWPCLPGAFNLRRRLLEMLKLGLVLGLALLPYVSIYLSYHQGGKSNSDYDLVYFILTNYFPYDLLNIPGALKTFFFSTSQFGLLWFGLVGFTLTFLLFRRERGRLKQMLFWIAGITFVTIFIPFVEQNIEGSLRIIPLQTELMRGMRYLVPFLFIFWFYPFAEFTNRAIRPILSRIVFVVGTILALSWLLLNPPYPFVEFPKVAECWSQGKLICPVESDYATALRHIRQETPEKAKFVVFLKNRWSGIEVRYLGLRPMAYAYKDRGQLAFTNLEALQTWFYFLQRENAIYSRNTSPTLDLQQHRMIDFAMDAEANYMLTDFPFPADVQKKLDVNAVYQNNTFTILRIYKMRK
jgi:hypothetical protein